MKMQARKQVSKQEKVSNIPGADNRHFYHLQMTENIIRHNLPESRNFQSTQSGPCK